MRRMMAIAKRPLNIRCLHSTTTAMTYGFVGYGIPLNPKQTSAVKSKVAQRDHSGMLGATQNIRLKNNIHRKLRKKNFVLDDLCITEMNCWPENCSFLSFGKSYNIEYESISGITNFLYGPLFLPEKSLKILHLTLVPPEYFSQLDPLTCLAFDYFPYNFKEYKQYDPTIKRLLQMSKLSQNSSPGMVIKDRNNNFKCNLKKPFRDLIGWYIGLW